MSAKENPTDGTQMGAEPDSGPDTDVSNLDHIGKQSRSNGADLTKGEIFDLLKNGRRREVIAYLRENDGSAKLDELAEHIAAKENDTTVRQLSSDQRKRVYIGLYQCHLPKMDTLGVVEYDKNRGTVDLQDSVASLEQYIDSGGESAEEPTWVIPGIAAGVVFLVGLGTMGIGALSAVPTVGWTVFSLLGLIAIALLQYRY